MVDVMHPTEQLDELLDAGHLVIDAERRAHCTHCRTHIGPAAAIGLLITHAHTCPSRNGPTPNNFKPVFS